VEEFATRSWQNSLPIWLHDHNRFLVESLCLWTVREIYRYSDFAWFRHDSHIHLWQYNLCNAVNQARTALALRSSVNRSGRGRPVTFTATITPLYGSQASGTSHSKMGRRQWAVLR